MLKLRFDRYIMLKSWSIVATLRRERNHCKQLFAFPSSMRVHVIPTSKRQMATLPLVSQETFWKHYELKYPTTRRQRERQQNNGFNKQNNNFAPASRFFVHFFRIFIRLRLENAYFRVLWITSTSNDKISFLFLNLDMVPRNPTPVGYAYI